MMFSRPLGRGLALALLGVLLAGCISLLPKTKPAQLYRFGAEPIASPPAAPGQARFTVRAAASSFDRASASDRILTVTGAETAYIAGARWVTPAVTMFDEAVVHAFDRHGGAARLLALGETARADYSLKLDVRRFEARYDHGAQAAPTIVVEVYAALDNPSDLAANREHIFQATIPADENRVGAISAAFDRAVAKVLAELIEWVDTRGAG